MHLPSTYSAELALIVFSIVCWGSWANLLKLGRSGRFELFYYDFAWGALLCAAVAAFTFGTLNSKELTFQENLLIAGYRNMAFAFGLGGRLRRELSESAERSPPSRPLGAPRLARISGFGVSRESAAGSGFYMPRRGDCGEL